VGRSLPGDTATVFDLTVPAGDFVGDPWAGTGGLEAVVAVRLTAEVEDGVLEAVLDAGFAGVFFTAEGGGRVGCLALARDDAVGANKAEEPEGVFGRTAEVLGVPGAGGGAAAEDRGFAARAVVAEAVEVPVFCALNGAGVPPVFCTLSVADEEEEVDLTEAADREEGNGDFDLDGAVAAAADGLVRDAEGDFTSGAAAAGFDAAPGAAVDFRTGFWIEGWVGVGGTTVVSIGCELSSRDATGADFFEAAAPFVPSFPEAFAPSSAKSCSRPWGAKLSFLEATLLITEPGGDTGSARDAWGGLPAFAIDERFPWDSNFPIKLATLWRGLSSGRGIADSVADGLIRYVLSKGTAPSQHLSTSLRSQQGRSF
jgi:hypothetical protein